MEMLLFRAFLAAFALILLQVHAQEPGFISIDCGANSNYTDSQTGLYYVSDASFVETGISSSVALSYQSDSLEKPLWTLRSFPEGSKNCYHVKVTEHGRYLMRAYFFYGNYDEKVTPPKSFDLYLGVNLWDSVVLGDVSTSIFKEIIHVSPSNYIDVCLVNTGSGTPFISSLEFRPLRSTTYVTQSGSLMLYKRMNVQPTTNRTIRYPDDVFDRVWMAYNNPDWKQLSVVYIYDVDSNTDYKPPQIVLESAGTPKIASDPLQFSLSTPDSTSQLYVYMHFAEIEYLSENQSRRFNISLNGGLNGNFSSEPISPCYTCATTFHFPSVFIGGHCDILITKTEDSTLPPILNAVEFYLVKDFAQSETDQVDADAIKNIKSLYKIKDWQGDPCAPQEYLWDGLDCSFNGSNPPRIISLNLSSNGLTGEIPPYISNLTMIQHL
ncbi:putative leucine-rich repeat receptor-like protein kinase At2g19210 [Pistacia vera]|uniref:putative leucine-rich repeat receptor-like protein kinase At2g19210 n=1 Tax=Pistacia vera TaxID=55513 RepID=UPI001263E0EA|nr:putative leucine-rich repeat receptor-like protein kinase At2g19210 [Pistacia vera]